MSSTPERIGTYEVLERIGRGGTAEVFKGRQASLNRFVAIKILWPEYVADERVVERFRREKDAIASLVHPNIIHIYEYLEEAGRPCYVMEYLEAKTLQDIIDAAGFLSAGQAMDVTLQLLDALGYAHERNIIHRDIKPANIFIDDQWRLKLTDFGLAKQIDRQSDLTQAKGPVGTPYYMAPEQVRCEATGPWTDIYQAAIVLYHMVTGHVPFTGRSPYEVTMKVLRERLAFEQAESDRIPPSLRAFIVTATSKEPAGRFQTARAMADDLRKIRDGAASGDVKEGEFASYYKSGLRHGVFICRKLGIEAPLTKAATYIGRGPGVEVAIPDSTLAPKQAMIRFSGGQYTLIGSNRDIGMTVNDERVHGKERILEDGDVVKISGYDFVFIDPR